MISIQGQVVSSKNYRKNIIKDVTTNDSDSPLKMSRIQRLSRNSSVYNIGLTDGTRAETILPFLKYIFKNEKFLYLNIFLRWCNIILQNSTEIEVF